MRSANPLLIIKILEKDLEVLLSHSVGHRPNQCMKLTRVVPVKDSKYASKSLAYFELCQHRLRAVYVGRYTSMATVG
jgi:hypothetical protein